MEKNTDNSLQVKLDFESSNWPAQEKFPLNIKDLGRKVEPVVYGDIINSKKITILTGFTSLSNLIDFFGAQDIEKLKEVHIVIGFEPNIRGRKRYIKYHLDTEIKNYWLKIGLSILLGGAVINLIEKINRGEVCFRFIDKLHAKIYVADSYATLGSSNFSKNGLTIQDEANIREGNNVANLNEFQQFQDISLIAKNYYELAKDYNSKIIELLNELIQTVTWEEALARGIAEILEGRWLAEYNEIATKLENAKLWPTQWKGLAQAITILQSQSNLLIADPTGAGKTKLCTSVILSLKQWLIETGQSNTNSLIICPPLVLDKWNDEFQSFVTLNNYPVSMGLLSNPTPKRENEIIKALELSNILTIDEAHNYLSTDSNRTKFIKRNQCDFKILVTATPISKKVEDLLTLINLLDVDNLGDDDFETYKELVRKPSIRNEKVIENLRNFISQFTIRRTKRKINNEIDKQPDKYVNKLGKTCRFPKQNSKTYTTKETQADKTIVKQINELCTQIKGITHLRRINKPQFDNPGAEIYEQYANKRLSSAKALCVYLIRSSLRSSKVALLEHIEGTKVVMEEFEFLGKTNGSGNTIEKLEEIIYEAQLPKIYRNFPMHLLPDWLTDKEKYLDACNNELQIYKTIGKLCRTLSNKRELGKIKQLIDLSAKHQNILAFDSTVITLYYLKNLIEKTYPNQKILIATGSEKAKDSESLFAEFKLESVSKESYIALCSDKMSEGVDLQKASCVLLLDMPSVLRLVEQRIGRADRMDTMHTEVDIYWPNDSEEFSLSADSRLINTNTIVENIFGSNISIPEDLREKHFNDTSSVRTMIKEYEEFTDKDESWKGIHDSFTSIADLKEGPTAIIKEKDYNEFKDVSASVKTKVSFVETDGNWCFICTRGTKDKSPKWYFIKDKNKILTNYTDICEALRNSINGATKSAWEDKTLKNYITILQLQERKLLPPKKKRALEVAELIISAKLKNKQESFSYKELLNEMKKMLNPAISEAVDYERLADEWIKILQPELNLKRANLKRKREVINLSSLKREAKNFVLSEKQLLNMIENNPIVDSIDNKIASCIIGVAISMRNSDLANEIKVNF